MKKVKTLTDAQIIDWLQKEAHTLGGLLLHAEKNTGRRGLGLETRTLREAVKDCVYEA